MNEEKSYPTEPNADGFYFEDSEEETLGISTKKYENGNLIKQALLPRCNKTAVIRELSAADSKDISRLMDKDAEKYQMACVAVAVTFNGEKLPIEEISKLKMADYTRLVTMNQALNF